MSLILQLETATASCSVALSLHGKTIAFKEQHERNIHASHITVFIEQLMEEAGRTMQDLDAVAVSKGPGSYTGLRIGVSTAKGLCYALDIPLLAVNTLQAMAAGISRQVELKKNILLCPMIDARRMEVYTAIYTVSGEELVPTAAEIVDAHSFSGLLAENKILFFGDGAAKCQPVLAQQGHAVFITDFVNSARDLSVPAYHKFQQKDFEDIAYFEPYYLKDFLIKKD